MRLSFSAAAVMVALAATSGVAQGANAAAVPPKKDRGQILITFDDIFQTQYDVAYAELKKRHLCGTFYTITGHAETPTDQEFYASMTWTELADLRNNCNEIASHTVNHDDPLTSLKDFKLNYELQFSGEELERWLNLKPPMAFAPPYGAIDDHVRQFLMNAKDEEGNLLYSSSMGLQGDPTHEGVGLNSPAKFDRWNIARQVVNYHTLASEVCAMVKHAGADDPWNPTPGQGDHYIYAVGFHSFADAADPILNDPKLREYVTSKDTFLAIMDCIAKERDLGYVDVVTVSDLVGKLPPLQTAVKAAGNP